MEIDLQTKIGDLLEAYPALEGTLMELSPAFAKLRSPVLRRTVAKVATVQHAARIAGISPAEMVLSLRKAAGLSAGTVDRTDDGQAEESRPDWFELSRITIRFDASPIIDAGQSPMSEIIRLSEELGEGGIMELTAPFRPEPIMDMLRTKGFKVWYGNGKAYFVK